MKFLLLLPFALLLGLIIGGWAPKEELRAAKTEVEALKKKLADSDKGSRLNDFTRMVQIPERAKKPAPADKKKSVTLSVGVSASADGANKTGTAVSANTALNSNNAAPDAALQRQNLAPEDLRARIDEAKELWKTRVDVARAQWIDRLKLTPEQTAQFDESMNTMNEKLYYAMQGMADALEGVDKMTPEVGTRAFSEMTAALAETYDSLHAIVPEGQGADISKIELPDFIDPAVADPLISIEGKLDPGGQSAQRHRGMGLLR